MGTYFCEVKYMYDKKEAIIKGAFFVKVDGIVLNHFKLSDSSMDFWKQTLIDPILICYDAGNCIKDEDGNPIVTRDELEYKLYKMCVSLTTSKDFASELKKLLKFEKEYLNKIFITNNKGNGLLPYYLKDAITYILPSINKRYELGDSYTGFDKINAVVE